MGLHVALLQSQVDAAGRVHGNLRQWGVSDAALAELRARVPGFSESDCLLKTVTVNAIYGTNVLAVGRMARHVHGIMQRQGTAPATIGIVSEIAKLSTAEGGSGRTFTSFASKFCHFFIDAESFPIYDDAACDTLRLHLGERPKAHDYVGFCCIFRRLREEAGLQCSTRELDWYLWLTGMYMRWLRQRMKDQPQVNAELLEVFRRPTREQIEDLDRLLPVGLERGVRV